MHFAMQAIKKLKEYFINGRSSLVRAIKAIEIDESSFVVSSYVTRVARHGVGKVARQGK